MSEPSLAAHPDDSKGGERRRQRDQGKGEDMARGYKPPNCLFTHDPNNNLIIPQVHPQLLFPPPHMHLIQPLCKLHTDGIGLRKPAACPTSLNIETTLQGGRG